MKIRLTLTARDGFMENFLKVLKMYTSLCKTNYIFI